MESELFWIVAGSRKITSLISRLCMKGPWRSEEEQRNGGWAGFKLKLIAH